MRLSRALDFVQLWPDANLTLVVLDGCFHPKAEIPIKTAGLPQCSEDQRMAPRNGRLRFLVIRR
jgi:hypothetical protein